MKVFFNESGVTVSSTHLRVHGKNYELKKISSVSYKNLSPNYSFSVFCLLLGLLLALDEGVLFALGGCLILGGIIAALTAQSKHVAVLVMPEGQRHAIISSDKTHVDRVINAIQTSMRNRQYMKAPDISEKHDEIKVFTSRMAE